MKNLWKMGKYVMALALATYCVVVSLSATKDVVNSSCPDECRCNLNSCGQDVEHDMSDRDAGRDFVTFDEQVKEFTGINTSGGIRMTYVPASRTSVKVKVRENLKKYLTVEVKDKVLHVKIPTGKGTSTHINTEYKDGYEIEYLCDEDGCKGERKNKIKIFEGDIEVTVSSPVLKSISTGVNSSFTAKGSIDFGKSLEIAASTGGSITLSSITVTDLEVHVSTGGNLSAGKVDADETGMHVSTGATVSIGNLIVRKADVKVSTGSNVNLSGKGGNLKLNCSTGSVFNGSGFSVKEAEGSVSTGSAAKVNAERNKVKGDITASYVN